ncbi:MAG: indole-3-glycerol phosphate synthase TrpC [Acidobacteriota bacterium]|nr:indole-3-glycerol phosphate synthase TrpC [Acidobacteriota bacterium]
MRASILEAIVAASRRSSEVRESRVPLASLKRRPRVAAGDDAFRRALRGDTAARGPRVIAECKRRSPSSGILRTDYEPAAIALSYERAGAAAISVLTEPSFFDGDLPDLEVVRGVVQIPVLRKDFIVTRYQVAEARDAGADAVLLIVAALDDVALRELLTMAHDEGMEALVEVHDAHEVERALAAGARIIGVNSRNLHTLAVDIEIFDQVAGMIPRDVTAVAESGIRDAATMSRVGELGYHACLIGERFMTTPDPGAALRTLLGRL